MKLGVKGRQLMHSNNCAQVKVTGGGSGTPGPLVKIPGVYKSTDPAVNFSIWGSATTYNLIPGPAVWGGGSFGSPPVAASPAGSSASAQAAIPSVASPVTTSRAAGSTLSTSVRARATVEAAAGTKSGACSKRAS
jgi:hypothetical protein